MKKLNITFYLVLAFIISGCTDLISHNKSGKPLTGTNTVIVGIYIDEKGYPQPTADQVDVHPGQRIFFAGPEKFTILFKDQRSPVGRLELESVNGIVVIEIPKDILERNGTNAAGVQTLRDLIYRYGIRANGNVTDPTIHIIPGQS